MSTGKLSLFILMLVFAMGLTTGCARFATTGKTMDRIVKKAPMGISEQDFNKKVRYARLVSEVGDKKVYLYAFGEPCLVCSTGGAFLKSFEPYAMKFTFTDGTLSAIERFVGEK